MDTVIQPLRDEAPLHSYIGVLAAERQALVDRPCRRTMVVDHVVRSVADVHRIDLLSSAFSSAAPEEAHDGIVCLDAELAIAQANPVSGSGLACNRDVRVGHADRLLQVDDSTDAKDDHARPFGFARGAQAARSAIVQIRYGNDATATSPFRASAKPF